MGIIIWFCALFLFFSENLAVRSNDNLLSVVVLYRHGARTPVKLYKNDPYAADIQKLWSEGFGQLNDEGVRQQFLLGKWLRMRYGNFLRPKYHMEDIFVRSSNIDRCLMSATSTLAGLYAPPSAQAARIGEAWRPVPIHTEPEVEDAVLVGGKPCPKYDRLYDAVMKTDTFVNLREKNRDLFQYLSRFSGEDVTDFPKVLLINDVLNVESSYNLTLPTWTHSVYPEKIGKVIGFFWTGSTYTKELARLRIGPLVELIAKQLEATSDRIPDTPKFLMLSAHDTTLLNLMNSLSIYDMVPPKYSSAVIFELRQGSDTQYVNIFYKNGTYSDEAYAKTLFGCEFDCCLKEFKEIVAPLRIDEESWERECWDSK